MRGARQRIMSLDRATLHEVRERFLERDRTVPPRDRDLLMQVLQRVSADVLTRAVADHQQLHRGGEPAAELLMIGYGARQHIRKDALQHLHQEITITRRQGSIALEESLARLVREQLVEHKDALTRAAHPEEFERAVRG